jgi:hypothetical protein
MKSVAMSAQSTKRPRVVTTLEMKLIIIAGFEAGKLAITRNVEADFRCYKEVLIEIKKARIQPTLRFLFQQDG